ncbi:MAG: hypothetical protein ABIH41_00700 [Nanoarchaeota archaeon]
MVVDLERLVDPGNFDLDLFLRVAGDHETAARLLGKAGGYAVTDDALKERYLSQRQSTMGTKGHAIEGDYLLHRGLIAMPRFFMSFPEVETFGDVKPYCAAELSVVRGKRVVSTLAYIAGTRHNSGLVTSDVVWDDYMRGVFNSTPFEEITRLTLLAPPSKADQFRAQDYTFYRDR